MCSTCGCESDEVSIEGVAGDHARAHAAGAPHSHGHDHSVAPAWPHGHAHEAGRPEGESGPAHAHAPGLTLARMVNIEQDILAKNDGYAAHNRKALAARGIFALNLVSGPGAGKTALLVKTIRALGEGCPISVIEGDQQTSHDAERIRATGARAVQINTGKGCHLDAHMVGHALAQLNPPQHSILMIENVGNLVCPAAFDLGEAHKVVLLSVTEGEDKPLKYPGLFNSSDAAVITKVDLAGPCGFDRDLALKNINEIRPGIRIFETSAKTVAGMDEWFAYLAEKAQLS